MTPGSLVVSTGPHCHCGRRVATTYRMVLVALLPATIAGIARYGADALGIVALAIGSAMAAEALWQRLLGRPVTVADGSAATSGLLLALLLPATMPAHMVVVATVLAIIVGKQCFGGLGCNPLNPALVGYAILRITEPWSGYLDFDLALVIYDVGFSKEYPEAVFRTLGASGLADFDLLDLLLGRQTGGIGSSQIAWLLLGGVFLVLRGTIRWQIPASFLAGVVLTATVLHAADGDAYAGPLFNLVVGNVMIGAFFLATDHSSSPVSRWGLLVYGLGAGVLTVLLRAWSTFSGATVFSILVMSLFVPLLDRLRRRTPQPPPPATSVAGAVAATGEVG